MILHPYQQRLIAEWFRAARQGKRLVLLAPRMAGMATVYDRIREIERANPQLFPSAR